MNMNLECMNPIPILVLPTGSMQRKDGTAGRKVIFNAKGYNEETGVNTEFLDKNTGEVGTYFKIPCSKCIPCKMRKSREWITRGQMEATLYDSDDMCFLTLTYDDTHVPYTENGNMTLKHKDVQNFMDYLRKLIKRSGSDKKIRFLMSGEYGSKGERPHYHILLFGYNFFAKAKYVGES